MPNLAARAAMGADPALRPRVAAAVIQLAIQVVSEPLLGDDAPPLDRAAGARRRAYALGVTDDVPTATTRAQWAIACWHGSDLADAYMGDPPAGADAITDEQIMASLAAAWTATGGA